MRERERRCVSIRAVSCPRNFSPETSTITLEQDSHAPCQPPSYPIRIPPRRGHGGTAEKGVEGRYVPFITAGGKSARHRPYRNPDDSVRRLSTISFPAAGRTPRIPIATFRLSPSGSPEIRQLVSSPEKSMSKFRESDEGGERLKLRSTRGRLLRERSDRIPKVKSSLRCRGDSEGGLTFRPPFAPLRLRLSFRPTPFLCPSFSLSPWTNSLETVRRSCSVSATRFQPVETPFGKLSQSAVANSSPVAARPPPRSTP